MNSLPLPSFIELLIKQTCRRASYEFEMGSKLSTENPPGIYSLEFLKSLYEKPRENIHRVLKNSDLKVPNGLNLMCSKEFSTVGFRRLLDFFNKVKDMSPPKSQNWIDLQHYMHYVYRNFVSANPDPTAEVLSSFFINEIKALVNSLRQEDESQLYLRVLALLREYCIFAQWNYSKTDGERCITKLFYYYEAMLSAAKNLNTVFSDFECILYKNYSICWIDFNTCVFINYFFETEFVKNKIYKCLETKVSPGDTLPMFGLLEDLKNLWIREQVRIITLHQESVIDDTNELYEQEEATVAAHKKLLSSNFWIERSENEINNLNLDRFDHQIFRLFGDPLFHPAGPILDRHGQCICEECLIAKYKCILDDNQDQFGDKLLKNVQRLSYCRMCQSLVDLESFHRHINSHAMSNLDNKLSMLTISSNLSRIISEKIDFVKLGNEPLNLPDVVSPEPTAPEDKSTFHPPPNKDPQPKLANEPPVFKNTFDSKYSNTSNEIDNTKFAFEEFLKHRKENATKNEHILNKNVRNFIKIKKDIFNHSNGNLAEKMFDDVLKATHIPVAQNAESPLENEVNKLREIRKNGHKPYPVTCKPATLVPKARCEHSCKHEGEAKPNICPGHTCDHHKESKKCECTYCEVFGTSVTSHSHKTNELRDKLRIRLHQRREKRTKDICKAPITAANANNPNRIKSTVNKVEERVPLPSSPTNIPPAPSVKLADSSTITSSTPHDIHGLLSYIEGHSVLNQLELAEKKAAKKARQRMKKEEERIKFEEEQRKLAEAIKRKEEEKKREIARLLAEKERAKALSEALTQKQIKKRAKKERQAQKRQLAQKPVCEERPAERGEVMEQTIPAMVTIKKSDNGDSAPKVTITLKGSTPDQDKLLHTLVKDSDNGNSENQNLNSTGAKKKKKKKQYNRLEPTVIAKELKVTLAVDSNRVNTQSKMMNKNIDEEIQAVETNEFKIEPTSHEDLDIPMLRLPPGITITKVAGPVINRKYEVGSLDDQKGTPISVAKSGVIVVDTEKLIQNNKHHHIDLTQKATKSSKRNKKKKNQKEAPATTPTVPNVKRMITLKNPLFQTFHPRPDNPLLEKNVDGCSPATIITNENGMVTIRSSRLQHSLSNNTGLAPVPSVPLPNLIPEMTKIKKTNTFMPAQSISDDKDDISPLNAQEILSGLPGIEITKVDKKAIKSNAESNKFCQTAQVSIIPTANGGDKFNFDKDDWLYDSVFTPRDVLEDDMDAEELELEAFKRFCQQSVPPKRKEKVAHLNVADIVFKKKTDINYF